MIGVMVADNAGAIVFGNKNFWPEVVGAHKEFFLRIGRLQEAVSSVADRAYEGVDGYQQLQISMLMLTATGMAEIVTLLGNGMGHGAMKIVPGVMENSINAEYMRQFPDQADKYLESQWVEQHKLYNHMVYTSPDSLKNFPAEKRAADEAEYQRVKPLFTHEIQATDGSRQLVMQDSWRRDNLFQRAEKVNMAGTYRTVIPSANQILHGSIGSWIRELDEVSRRIEYPPTHKWGGEALIAAHLALLQAVETCSLSLDTNPTPSLDVLKEDFHVICGDPPMQEAESQPAPDPSHG